MKSTSSPERKRSFIIILLLTALCLGVFAQVACFDFVNFDDPIYVTKNEQVQKGWSFEGVQWAFTTHLHGHYHPLTWLSHMTDIQFFGLKGGGHHMTNLLLHLLNTIILFLVLTRMTGEPLTSCFAAALFAVHPLHVEPVAWITSRKDLLYAFFYLSALWVYVAAGKRLNLFRHLLLILLFTIGLLAKSMMITLPAILLLLDFWPLQRFKVEGQSILITTWRLVLEKAGLILVAAVFVAVSVTAIVDLQVEDKTLSPHWRYDSLLFLAHYLEKFFWPFNLTPIYRYQENPSLYHLAAAGILLLVITVAVLAWRKKYPFLLFGWLWFMLTLMPVLGILHGGPHRIADRYVYVPIIGLIIMVSWTVPAMLAKTQWRKPVCAGLALLVLAAGSLVAFGQAAVWKSSVELFQHALKVRPGNWVAHNNLGDILARQGDKEKAITHFEEAIRLRPQYVKAWYNLGNALASQKRMQDALHCYQQAISLKPDFAEAHNNAGVLLARRMELQLAEHHFTTALSLKPDYSDAQRNLQDIQKRLNLFNRQIDKYRKMLAASPDNAELYNSLGVLYRDMGEEEQALQSFLMALQIDSNHAGVHNNLGIIHADRGDLKAAIFHLEQAVLIDPNYEAARKNLQRAQSLFEKRRK